MVALFLKKICFLVNGHFTLYYITFRFVYVCVKCVISKPYPSLFTAPTNWCSVLWSLVSRWWSAHTHTQSHEDTNTFTLTYYHCILKHTHTHTHAHGHVRGNNCIRWSEDGGRIICQSCSGITVRFFQSRGHSQTVLRSAEGLRSCTQELCWKLTSDQKQAACLYSQRSHPQPETGSQCRLIWGQK